MDSEEFRFPLRALFLEDDELWADEVSEDLAAAGFEVDIAETVREATKMSEEKGYDIVIADVVLSEEDDAVSGDRWIIEHKRHHTARFRSIFTAFPNNVTDKSTLEQEGIAFFKKEVVGDTKKLEKSIARVAEERRAEITATVTAAVRRSLSEGGQVYEADEAVATEARGAFLSWLRSRTDQDSKHIIVHGSGMSISDLANEVEKGTPIGRDLVKMFASHIRRLIGLED